MKNANEQHHKRHSSLTISSTGNSKQCLNKGLSNSKSLNFTTNQSLTIKLSGNDDNHTASPTTTNSVSSGSIDFSMDTLFEDSVLLQTQNQKQQQQQQQQQKSPPKFIGLLRPSKSDTSSMYKKKRIRQLKSQDDLQEKQQNENITTSPLSQSWNDMTQQPLSKLKSVLSRLQTANNEVNVMPSALTTGNTTNITAKRNASKNNNSNNVSNTEDISRKKKSKKSVVILDLPPAERKKKYTRKEQNSSYKKITLV
ncbi:unnamed protein product [Mucor hiemalis]